MSDLKISEMDDGGQIQENDQIPVVRSGQNFRAVESGRIRIDEDDEVSGYLEDKIINGEGIESENQTLSSGEKVISLSLRNRLAETETVSAGTTTLDYQSGDLHKVIAEGDFVLEAQMDIGQSILVRAIDFNDHIVDTSFFQWGDIGEPTWTEKDDFVIYRGYDGEYQASVIMQGIV